MEELEKYAKENNVPIMQKDGMLYLCEYIRDNNVKSILEIGSAIGYSSIMMASVNSGIRIKTIEKDEERYNIAVDNINKYGFDRQISIYLGDASDFVFDDEFDLIFIDAAKGKNTFFFEKFKGNLKDGGTIITDNLSFHGLVEDESLVKTKNQRGIVNKIKSYMEFLDNNKEFDTKYVEVGDKIAISKEVKLMSNFVIIPSKREDIDVLLKKGIKGIIIGVKDLSIYSMELSIDEIVKIADTSDKNIIIAMNKMIHNKDLELVREVLDKVKTSKIYGIMFYDLGVFNICKSMNIDKELILSQEHLNASTCSNEFYYSNGIRGTFITSDITGEEVLDINNNTKMNVYYTVYGYLPIFYSRRYLLTNYFKYVDKDMEDDTYYIFNNNSRYMIREYDYGTIIYSPLLNLINEMDKIKDISNFVIDLSYTDDIGIIDKFINTEKMDDTDTLFFDKKTIYKLKDEK